MGEHAAPQEAVPHQHPELLEGQDGKGAEQQHGEKPDHEPAYPVRDEASIGEEAEDEEEQEKGQEFQNMGCHLPGFRTHTHDSRQAVCSLYHEHERDQQGHPIVGLAPEKQDADRHPDEGTDPAESDTPDSVAPTRQLLQLHHGEREADDHKTQGQGHQEHPAHAGEDEESAGQAGVALARWVSTDGDRSRCNWKGHPCPPSVPRWRSSAGLLPAGPLPLA